MAEHYRVLRAFPGPGGERLTPGKVYDGTAWRNAPKLVAHGFLMPAPAPERKEPERAKSRHEG